MADAASTPSANIATYGEGGALLTFGTTTVSGLATSKAADLSYWPAVWTLQVSGTYGGATWTLQGSNNNSTWFTLNDTTATPVPATFSVGDKLMNIKERPRYVRLISTGGTGTALVAIINATKF